MRFLFVLVVLGVIAAGVVEWANAAWDAPGLPARSGNRDRGPDRAAYRDP